MNGDDFAIKLWLSYFELTPLTIKCNPGDKSFMKETDFMVKVHTFIMNYRKNPNEWRPNSTLQQRQTGSVQLTRLSYCSKTYNIRKQVLIRLVQTICAWLHVQQVDMCAHTHSSTLNHTASSSNHTHTHARTRSLTQSSTKWSICSFI